MPGSCSLADTRDALLALPDPFTAASVHSVVKRWKPDPDEIADYLNFSDEGYRRTRYYLGPRFEILVMCWRDGQASPIHDHADSFCSMAVAQGCCRAENYQVADGRLPSEVAPEERVKLELIRALDCGEGRVVTLEGQDIHRISNLQGNGADLVTVHFYLPAIPAMRCFDDVSGRCLIREPVTLMPRHRSAISGDV